MADSQQQPGEHEARQNGSILNFMSASKIAAVMWATRWYVVYLCLQFMLFGSAFDKAQYFQRAFIANAVICAFRLHQRVPDFRFSREYLGLVMQEDSAHYLLYSFIFISAAPIAIPLVPVAIFALMHGCSYTRKMIDMHGTNSYPVLRKLINYVAKHQTFLFRFVALNEAIIFPVIISMVFMGRAAIFSPFIYYRFLQYRYLSKRNPYSRSVFYEFRIALEHMIRNPKCPSFVVSLVQKAIQLVCRLAPPVLPTASQTN